MRSFEGAEASSERAFWLVEREGARPERRYAHPGRLRVLDGLWRHEAHALQEVAQRDG